MKVLAFTADLILFHPFATQFLVGWIGDPGHTSIASSMVLYRMVLIDGLCICSHSPSAHPFTRTTSARGRKGNHRLGGGGEME